MKLVFTFITVLFIFLSNRSYSQMVITYAGNGSPGLNINGTQKLLAPFNGPWGLAFDNGGRLWVSEETGSIIKVILPNGTVWNREGSYNMPGFADGTGYGTTRFSGPRGIAVGPGDTIYVADRTNHLIRKISPFFNVNPQTVWVMSGKYGMSGGTPGYVNGPAGIAQFNFPSDVAVDQYGNVYVADEGNHCIRKILPDGTASLLAGVPKSPGYLDGTLTTAKFNYPTGICLAPNGDIYVADNAGQRIRLISGNMVSTVGNFTYPPLWQPNDVALDPSGNIYIADQHRVLKIIGPKIYYYAGPYGRDTADFINGLGNIARFNNVMGLVVDPKNSNILYVADRDNCRIRQITLCNLSKPVINTAGNTLTAPSASSYRWFKDGKLISGAVYQQYIAVQTGDYQVEITDVNGCIALSDKVYIYISTIFEQNGRSSIEIYPNPSTGIINLKIITSESAPLLISVIDVLGKNVFREEIKVNSGIFKESIDLSELYKGIYLIRLNQGSNTSLARLILQ